MRVIESWNLANRYYSLPLLRHKQMRVVESWNLANRLYPLPLLRLKQDWPRGGTIALGCTLWSISHELWEIVLRFYLCIFEVKLRRMCTSTMTSNHVKKWLKFILTFLNNIAATSQTRSPVTAVTCDCVHGFTQRRKAESFSATVNMIRINELNFDLDSI